MKKADILIIGGGIIGCSTAYYLAQRGLSVIVLEAAESIGNGGSSRNGGGVRQSGRDPREIPMVQWGIQNLWPNLSEELGVDTEYTQKGNLRLGKTEAHLKILASLAEKAVKCGVHVEMIDREEVKAINPWLSDEVLGASWCPSDGHANPLTTTLGFYKRSREMGVQFITGEKVLKLKKEKGRIRKAVAENDVYEAEKILVAAGYESRQILKSTGIDVPMQKIKLECLVTEAQPKMFMQMLGTAEADFYGHQTKHGSFVFGGSTGFENIVDASDYISDSMAASATCRGIMKYFPELRTAKIVRTWNGYSDQCADLVPVIDAIEEVPGLYVACGFSGHGFGIGPAAGYNMAELMATGKTSIPIEAFRYDRFKARV